MTVSYNLPEHKMGLTHLRFAIQILWVQLESTRIEFTVFGLPRRGKRSAQLFHVPVHDNVGI